MSAPQRHVRVTITGTATAVLDSHQHPTSAIRVRYQGADREASTLLLVDSPNVTVEDLPAPREWTKGDVIAGDIAYTRNANGVWAGVSPMGSVINWTDAEVEDALADSDGGMELLRYQAGVQ